MTTIAKQKILVLGAGSDIAQAIARLYAEHQNTLILATKTPKTIDAFAQDLRIRCDVDVEVIELDVCEFESHEQFLANLPSDLFGVICAVGYLGNQQSAQQQQSELRRIAETNYLGIVALLEPIAARLEAAGAGFIIAIGSVAGDRGRQSNYHYGAAKAALSAYLSGLRNRLYSSGISVLEIRPGFVETKMTAHLELPAPLTTHPETVAQSVLKAQQRGRNIIYVKPVWRVVMWIIRCIPEAIFKRLKL